MTDPSIARFRRVISSAYASLEARRQEVNDLNVFPVADGDTGDNMAMTLRAVMEELDRLGGQSVDEVGRSELVQALARAALMGARGNSGVILSQILRGLSRGLRGKERFDALDLAVAFRAGCRSSVALRISSRFVSFQNGFDVSDPIGPIGVIPTGYRRGSTFSLIPRSSYGTPTAHRCNTDATPMRQNVQGMSRRCRKCAARREE